MCITVSKPIDLFEDIWIKPEKGFIYDLEIFCSDGRFWVPKPMFTFLMNHFGLSVEDWDAWGVLILPEVKISEMKAAFGEISNAFNLELCINTFQIDTCIKSVDLGEDNIEQIDNEKEIEMKDYDNSLLIGVKEEVYKTDIFQPSPETSVVETNTNKTTQTKLNNKCNSCDKLFPRKSKLIAHMQSVHSTDRPEACHLCSKNYKTKSDLTKHLKLHGIGSDFSCDIYDCDLTFKYKKNLIKHKQADHGLDKDKLICSECSISFEHYRKLNYHMEMKHPTERQLKAKAERLNRNQCDECGKLCNSSVDLKYHKRSHSNIKQFQCNQCDKTFKHKSGLYVHIRGHERNNTFECPKCEKKLSSKQSLEGHINVHDGVKQYSCSFCGKQFTTATMMQQHEKKHEDGSLTEQVFKRNFHCTKCEKSYSGPRGLRRHVASEHIEEMR